jgi:hypothetical protein
MRAPTVAALKRVITPGTKLTLVHSPGWGDDPQYRVVTRVTSVGFYYTGDNVPESGSYNKLIEWPKAAQYKPTDRGFIIRRDTGKYLEYEWLDNN